MEAFPLILYLWIIVSLTCIVRTDGPKFYIAQNDNDSAIKAIHRIYQTNGDDDIAQEILEFISSTIQKASTSVSLKEAFITDERYTRSSWVNVVMIVFHELTGINVVLMYSSTILETILGTEPGSFNAR